MKQITMLMALLLFSTLSFSQETFPIDFETGDYTDLFNNFGGTTAEIVDNPFSEGENTSAKVLKLGKKNSESWSGTGLIRTTNVDFSQNSLFTMKVYTNRVGAKIKLKIENNPNYETSTAKEFVTTKANEWEILTFDFAGESRTNLSTLVFYIDDGTAGTDSEDWIYYIDDITASASSKTFPGLPVDFEANIDFGIEDFNENITNVIDNPVKTGINTSDKVAYVQKLSNWWAGSAMTIEGTMDFTSTPIVSMKVYSPRAGVPILFKLEGSESPTELRMSTTKVNEWEYIDFDFKDATSGVYNKIVIFFDPEVDGVDNEGDVTGDGLGYSDFSFYYDDIELVATSRLSNDFSQLAESIEIYSVDKMVYLKNLKELNQGSIDMYSLTGQKISTKVISSDSENMQVSQTGLYVILLNDKDGNRVKAQKVLIK